MPSEEWSQSALEALREPRQAFRSAVAQAVDEANALIARLRSEDDEAHERQSGLGEYAAGRIDAVRFSTLFARRSALAPGMLAVMERSRAVLAEIAQWSDTGFLVKLDAGRDLQGAVGAALAMAGRAFGAARSIQLARTGRYRAGEHAGWVDAFPAAQWNRAERQIAPPLVVELDGGDLRAGELSAFLDGTQKLVLVVRSAAPSAALVRLITPGVLVAQIGEPAALPALLTFDGPAVVALVPETAARFVHRPSAGTSLDARLTVQHLPEGEARGTIGKLSAFRQNEELRQLAALTALAASARNAAAPGNSSAHQPVAEPADRLAAWLLSQAGFSNP